MLRYIKVKDKWIDTLQAMKSGLIYMDLDNCVYCLDSNTGKETNEGEKQDERETL